MISSTLIGRLRSEWVQPISVAEGLLRLSASRTWRAVTATRRDFVRSLKQATTNRRPPPGSARRATPPFPAALQAGLSWKDAATYMRAMVARRSWRERREALKALRTNAGRARELAHASRARQLARGWRRWRAVAVGVATIRVV